MGWDWRETRQEGCKEVVGGLERALPSYCNALDLHLTVGGLLGTGWARLVWDVPSWMLFVLELSLRVFGTLFKLLRTLS